jgi:T-complex protein 1 subunit theta
MSLKVPKNGQMQLFKEGYKVSKDPVYSSGIPNAERFLLLQTMSGLEEAVLRNIEAVSELSEKVRTSFGPNGKILPPINTFSVNLNSVHQAVIN